MYDFFIDPSHGWLKVSIKELKEMEILREITDYSFIMGDFIYLEEDQDLTLFIDTKKKLNPDFVLKTNENFSENESGIRKFKRFYPVKELFE